MSNPNCEDESIGDVLEKRIEALFEEASSLPVALSRNKSGTSIEVRLNFEGAHMTSLAEARVDRIPPSAFRGYLENFRDATTENDPTIKEMQLLGIDENDRHKREGIKVRLKLPFPLKERIMIHWKYLTIGRNGNEDEHLLILSEQNNEELLEKFLTKKEREKCVLARTFLCAYWIKPIRDQDDSNIITGSTIQYVFSGDIGGNIPKNFQEWVAPQTNMDTIRKVIRYGKNHAPGKC